MSNFEKGGQVTLAREKDPLVWPAIKTTNVFRDPYPGWGADRVCRDLPAEWFDVDYDPEERDQENFLADLETGERVCLDCPLAVECRDQALACKARGLFGAVVTTEGGKAWPVDVWVRMKVGGTAREAEEPKGPEYRQCALQTCPKKFTVSPKKATQKYCSPECSLAGSKARRRAHLSARGRAPMALAS
jgi:hypothetical protein